MRCKIVLEYTHTLLNKCRAFLHIWMIHLKSHCLEVKTSFKSLKSSPIRFQFSQKVKVSPEQKRMSHTLNFKFTINQFSRCKLEFLLNSAQRAQKWGQGDIAKITNFVFDTWNDSILVYFECLWSIFVIMIYFDAFFRSQNYIKITHFSLKIRNLLNKFY